MIKYETKDFIANKIISKKAIENELGIDITNSLIIQIKKDIINIGIGSEIFPSKILGENSGSWRSEYQAVYNHFYEKYKKTSMNPWDQSRKYIGKIYKYVVHNECEGNFLIYSKLKNGKNSNAYLRYE